jgi:hypothetical protein
MRRGDVWNKGANIFASKETIAKKNECLSQAKGNKYTMFGSCIDKEGHSVSLSGGKSRRKLLRLPPAEFNHSPSTMLRMTTARSRRYGRKRTIKNRSRRHRSRRARK